MTAPQVSKICGAELVRAGNGERVCPRSRCPRYLAPVPGDPIALDFAALAAWRPSRRAERPARKDWWRR